MPRRNRRDRDFDGPGEAPPARADAPDWAGLAGFDVRHVGGEKSYICPGCDHEIRQGVWHIVVVPHNDPSSRRHWHTECWRRELRRLGAYKPPKRWDP